MTYAKEADKAGEGNIGGALRLRVQRHEACEQLACGGFMTRPDFATLKADLQDMITYVDAWPYKSQQLVTKRTLVELCNTPGAVFDNWDGFLQIVACWPLGGDAPDQQKWSPLEPKLRFASAQQEDLVNEFLELFTEYAVGPMIKRGLAGETELVELCTRMTKAVEDANDIIEDDSCDAVFELVLRRVRGLVAIVSRQWGILGSSRADADALRAEGDTGESSIYNLLVDNDHYNERVSEFWQTLDQREQQLPAVRKMNAKVSKMSFSEGVDADHLSTLNGAIVLAEKVAPLVRPTQLDAFTGTLTIALGKLAGWVTQSAGDAAVTEHANPISKVLVDGTRVVGEFTASDTATGVINGIMAASNTAGAITKFGTVCESATEMFGKCPTIAELNIHTLTDKFPTDLPSGSVPADSEIVEHVVAAVNGAVGLVMSETAPEIPVCSATVVDKVSAVCNFIQKTSGVLSSIPETALALPKDFAATTGAALKVVTAYVQLGSDAAARYEKDKSLDMSSACIAAKLQLTEFLETCETKPGLVLKATSSHVIGLRSATATTALKTLAPHKAVKVAKK